MNEFLGSEVAVAASTAASAEEKQTFGPVVRVDAKLCWHGDVLSTASARASKPLSLGSAEGCDFVVPERTGVARQQPVWALEADGAVRVLLEGNDVQCTQMGRRLHGGDTARIELGDGLVLELVASDRAQLPLARRLSVDPVAQAFLGASLLLHLSVIGGLAFFQPALGADDFDGVSREQLLQMQKSLESLAARELREEPQRPSSGEAGGLAGQRAQGEEGAMGSVSAARANKRFAVQGPSDTQDAHLARAAAKTEAANFGMVGLLSSALAASDAPTAPWGAEQALGRDPMSAQGNLWGAELGDAFGGGALGLTGGGIGGGGLGTGVGLGPLGDLGNGFARDGGPGGFGTCGGGVKGCGHGRVGGTHVAKGPTMRTGKTEVGGRLPAEVVQRVVRQNFGRFRQCYETALRTNPSLSGRVVTRFVIDRSGAVSTALDGGSDLPDRSVISCVVRGFGGLSFPAPDNGLVTVTYPIQFTPGD